MISTYLSCAEEERGGQHPLSSLLCPILGVLIVDFVVVIVQSCQHNANIDQ
jgi:hypothetical protein